MLKVLSINFQKVELLFRKNNLYTMTLVTFPSGGEKLNK